MTGKSSKYNEIALFVLRRAWLFGKCARADINRALNLEKVETKNTHAAKIAVERALEVYAEYLSYIPNKGVFPNLSRPTPAEANAEVILDLVAKGEPAAVTGVLDGDLPLLVPTILPSRTMTAKVTQMVLLSALRRQPLRVLYVGLRHKETARWRQLWICALEHTGLYWRVHAQDLEASDHPVKVYVLGRILDAEPLDKAPKDFREKTIIKNSTRMRIHFTDALTPDQVQALSNMLNVNSDGTLYWPSHATHDFQREYGPARENPSIVWPIFSRIDELLE